MKFRHHAFTMLELVFVIVIMGIIGKFGVEFLAQSYQSFISSSINNTLQTNSATAVEFIASRLQHRIKASTIARENNASYTLLTNYFNATAPTLEWIGVDIDGYRGNALPLWSGIADLNPSTTVNLNSPASNTFDSNVLINNLSNNQAGIDDSAIYFIHPDAITTAEDWGWDANASRFDIQSDVQIHPIRASIFNTTDLVPVS